MDDNINNEFFKTFDKSLLDTLLEAMNIASRLYRSVLMSDYSNLAEEYWEIYLSVSNLYETLLKSKNEFL